MQPWVLSLVHGPSTNPHHINHGSPPRARVALGTCVLVATCVGAACLVLVAVGVDDDGVVVGVIGVVVALTGIFIGVVVNVDIGVAVSSWSTVGTGVELGSAICKGTAVFVCVGTSVLVGTSVGVHVDVLSGTRVAVCVRVRSGTRVGVRVLHSAACGPGCSIHVSVGVGVRVESANIITANTNSFNTNFCS